MSVSADYAAGSFWLGMFFVLFAAAVFAVLVGWPEEVKKLRSISLIGLPAVTIFIYVMMNRGFVTWSGLLAGGGTMLVVVCCAGIAIWVIERRSDKRMREYEKIRGSEVLDPPDLSNAPVRLVHPPSGDNWTHTRPE